MSTVSSALMRNVTDWLPSGAVNTAPSASPLYTVILRFITASSRVWVCTRTVTGPLASTCRVYSPAFRYAPRVICSPALIWMAPVQLTASTMAAMAAASTASSTIFTVFIRRAMRCASGRPTKMSSAHSAAAAASTASSGSTCAFRPAAA